MKSLYAVFALLFCAQLCIAAEPVGEMFVYKKVGDRELKLWVSKPADWKAKDKRPALVFFHGGGWVGGAPTSFNEHCKYFASRGLVSVTVEYRLLKGKTNDSPLVCVQDAKSAMRWVRSHAKDFGIDPKRIGAAGGSAGGHLAAFCGIVEGKDDPQDDLSISPKADALVLFNPVFNNGPGQWGHFRVGDSYKEFSPAHNITRDDPPTIIFLGSEDHLISVETTKAFQTEMQKLGIVCEFHISEGQKHGFYHFSKSNGKNYYDTVTGADKFLASLGWLKGLPTLQAPQPKPSSDDNTPEER
ncbi:MAG: alpha/beta hydrolase [Verrucomicrobia bacterium]|nr:alpha/beta hydrolase [Verrucomicrobiota bacterium]